MLEAIIESQNDLGVYLPWVPHALTEDKSIEQTKQAIENFEKELRYSIIEKTTGRFVGVIGLIIRDKAVPFFEIGYWLRSSSVGSGFMMEALQAIERHAFLKLNANRVEVKAAEKNVKSLAVAKRCGYTFEGVLRNYHKLPSGELSNMVVYSKTSL